MAATATVTTRVTDITGTSQPDWKPLVKIGLQKAAFTLDGQTIPTEPLPMVDDGDGNLSLDLIVTAEFIEPEPYIVTIDWLSPDGETSRHDRIFKIMVPEEGGNLGALTLVKTDFGLAWQGDTPPPNGLWLYVDPTYDPDSGEPLPTYTAPNGTITHGELIEWEA